MDYLIDEEAIAAARERVEKYLAPTPLIYSRHFSLKTGHSVYLKLEMLQPTRSFKVRGAFNTVASLSGEVRERGVVTASGGNHGLGVALACQKLIAPCTIYLPVSTPQLKVDGIRELGAEVILFGDSWDEANEKAIVFAAREKATYIHAFDNPLVMAGQGTMVPELVEQFQQLSALKGEKKPAPDAIVTSIGGGGLISGIISAVKSYVPDTEVTGVETEGANCMSASIEAGRIVELPAITSVCESLGARRTSERQFQIVLKHAKEVAVVSDEEAIEAVIELLLKESLLVEPAAGCSLAAITAGKAKLKEGSSVVVIMCGANLSKERLQTWLNTRSRSRRRLS